MPRSTRTRPLVTVLYYGFPVVIAGLGVYRLWAATGLDGTEAQKACVVGLLLLGCSVGFVAVRRCKVRSERDHVWEANQAAQARRLSRVEKEQAAIRQDVHSRLAVQEWLEAFDRVDAHKAGGWAHLNRRPEH